MMLILIVRCKCRMQGTISLTKHLGIPIHRSGKGHQVLMRRENIYLHMQERESVDTQDICKMYRIVASIVLGDELVFQVLKLSHRLKCLKLEKLKGLNDLELRRAPIRVLEFPILKDVMMLEKLTTWMITGIRDKSEPKQVYTNEVVHRTATIAEAKSGIRIEVTLLSSGEEIGYNKEEQLHILGYDQLRNNKGAIPSKKLGAGNRCCTVLAQLDW
uniref:Uncharacterized protein n=1 Tax=Tanacetum cinerariifolium TaxID=118510 RepID=A0A699IDV7_TANCI|nr:hypothetical protein [Tanacetum cinerariifolium]